MKKLLLLLLCFPLFCYSQINVGVDQTICFEDTAQIIATLPSGISGEWTGSPILITECDPGSPDIVEIQNVSAGVVDVTGWRVIVSNSYTLINTSNTIEQVLSGSMNPGALQSWSDLSSSANYWGNNLLWNPGAYPTFTTWIMLLDNNNNVMDVFVGNWLAADIANSAIVTSVGTISLAGQWNGDGVDQTSIGTTLQSFSRIGSDDNDDATDFIITSTTSGVTNNNLSLPFSGSGATWYDLSTSQIIGNGDTLYYSPLQSSLVVGEFIDTLGQIWSDTMYLEVLNTNISTTGVSLCNGPLVLTAPFGFSTYTWNGPSTTGVLTVSTPGIYYVNCVTANGVTCQSDPITIYLGNIPITLSTPDSVFICQGDTVVIDGPLGFANYFWSTGAINSSITTTSTGNYSLSVLDGNGCTGTSNTTSVIMSPQTITATTTGLSLCIGSVTLDAGSGYASYQWYLNNNPLLNSTNQNYIVNINSPGNYYVSVTYPTGCTATSNILTIISGSTQFSLTINAIGDDSLCLPNGPVILDAGSYASYQWGTNGAPIQGETTQTITITSVGVYYVNVTDANGCAGVSNPPFEVSNKINTSVISGPTNPTQYQNVTYSVNPSISSTYNWTLNGGTILSGQGTNSIDLEWINSGTLSISVVETDVNGCVGDTVFLPVFVIISEVDEENPTSHKLKKVTDVLGRISEIQKNTTLFYIYDDGTVEKKIIIE